MCVRVCACVRVLPGPMWFSLSGTSPVPHEARIAAAVACWPPLGSLQAPALVLAGQTGICRRPAKFSSPGQVFGAAAGSMCEERGGVGGGSPASSGVMERTACLQGISMWAREGRSAQQTRSRQEMQFESRPTRRKGNWSGAGLKLQGVGRGRTMWMWRGARRRGFSRPGICDQFVGVKGVRSRLWKKGSQKKRRRPRHASCPSCASHAAAGCGGGFFLLAYSLPPLSARAKQGGAMKRKTLSLSYAALLCFVIPRA